MQTAVAAGVAWYLATLVLGHGRPFFAAIAAVISLGLAVGQEGRRAAELVFGVACALALADLIVLAIGTGTVQIGVVVALAMAAAVLLEAGLSFLGLGAQPPTPEWGLMVADGRKYLLNAPWFATFPGLTIMVVVIAANVFGDGLRDLLDPRLRT